MFESFKKGVLKETIFLAKDLKHIFFHPIEAFTELIGSLFIGVGVLGLVANIYNHFNPDFYGTPTTWKHWKSTLELLGMGIILQSISYARAAHRRVERVEEKLKETPKKQGHSG